DRVVSVKIEGGQIHASSEDGLMTTIDGGGKIISQAAADANEPPPATAPKLSADLAKQALAGKVVKKIVSDNGLTAIGYWGGTVQILDAVGATKSSQMMANDVSDLAWLNGKLIVGVADGTVVALEAK